MGLMKGWSTSLMTTTPMIQEYLRKYARRSEYWLSPNFISSLLLVCHMTHSYLHTSPFMFKYPYIHIWNIHFQRSPYWRGVSVFPVGLVLKYGVSSPILRDGRVSGFYDAFQAGRKVMIMMIMIKIIRMMSSALLGEEWVTGFYDTFQA